MDSDGVFAKSQLVIFPINTHMFLLQPYGRKSLKLTSHSRSTFELKYNSASRKPGRPFFPHCVKESQNMRYSITHKQE